MPDAYAAWMSGSAKVPATGGAGCAATPPCCSVPTLIMTTRQALALKIQSGWYGFAEGVTDPPVIFSTVTVSSFTYMTEVYGGTTTMGSTSGPSGIVLTYTDLVPNTYHVGATWPGTFDHAGYTTTSNTVCTVNDGGIFNGVTVTLGSPVDPAYAATSALALGVTMSGISDNTFNAYGFDEFGQAGSDPNSPYLGAGLYMTAGGALDPSHYSPTTWSGSSITLSTGGYGPQFDLANYPVLSSLYMLSGWTNQFSSRGGTNLAYLRSQWKLNQAAAYWYGEFTVNANFTLNNVLKARGSGTASAGTW